MFHESCAPRSLSTLSGMLSEEKSMAIKKGNLLVAPGASGYISAVAGTKRFLARLSGRRRHVRRTSGTPVLSGDDDNACCNSNSNSNSNGNSNSDSNRNSSSTNSQKFNEDETPQPTPKQPRRTIVPHNTNTATTTTTSTSTSTSTDATTTTTTSPTTTTTTIQPTYFDTTDAVENTETAATTAPFFRRRRIPPYIATILIITYTFFGIADACSSRSTPKPRPPTPTPRPNITFHMYTCPPDYAEWYCLNGATCFTVKIAESLLYNCLCANGYIGQRCEFKDLDGSYLPSRQRVMLETASIAGGATIAVFLVVIICIAAYIHCKRKQKELRSSMNVDTVDGPGRDPELRPFGNHGRSLRIFMAKNGNNSTTSPSIEQTRMPEWNYPSPESTRMASISEGKRSNQ